MRSCQPPLALNRVIRFITFNGKEREIDRPGISCFAPPYFPALGATCREGINELFESA
jgi:hypothetical protein